MVRKTCPVCDQVMKSAHFCGNCRRIVRYPHVSDVNYYLNERHPQNEMGCSYHDEGSQKAVTAKNTEPPGMPSSPDGAWKPAGSLHHASPPARVMLPAGSNASGGKAGAKTKNKKAARSGSMAVAGILFIAGAVSIIASFSGQLYDLAWLGGKPTVEYDIDMGDYTGEEGTSSYRELEDEEVAGVGEGCNSRGHFALQGEMMEQPVRDILREAGYEIARQDTYSYNEASDDGGTWYATWITIEVKGEEKDSYQYVELDYDTGTGRLHEISLSLEDPKRLAAVTSEILAALAKQGELPADAACFTQVPEELPAALEEGSEFHILEGAVLIEGISYEKSYSVYISHNIDGDL